MNNLRDEPDPDPTPDGAPPISPPGDNTGAPAEQPRPRADRDLFGRSPKDRPDWSHRRGEPRVFALLWIIFLMIVTFWMFDSSGAFAGFDPMAFRPAAREGLMLMMVGVCAFWPAMRLSQSLPDAPRAAIGKDLLIVGFTTQALVWPQIWLSELGVVVTLALAAAVGGWVVLTGAFLAIALGGKGSTTRRGVGLTMCLALLGAGAVIAASNRTGSGDPLRSRAVWMGSPMTAIYEITRDRPWRARAGGRLTQSKFAFVGPVHVRGIWGLWVLAGASWIAAAFVSPEPNSRGDESKLGR